MKNNFMMKFSLLILLAVGAATSFGQPKSLFEATQQQGILPSKVDSLFLQKVNIIFDVAVLQSATNDNFRINLPGITKPFIINKTKQTFDKKLGSFSWYGQIQKQPESFVLFTAVKNAVSGYIRTNSNKVFQITYVGNDVHQIAEVNQQIYKSDNVNYPVAVADVTRDENLKLIDHTCCDTSGIIDVLVVYTNQAKINAAGEIGMQARIGDCIAITNESFRRSKIKTRIELVNSVEVDYSDEGYVMQDLNRMNDPRDGYLDMIQTLRNANNADVVVLIIGARRTSDLGWANVMTARSASFADSAFCVVDFAASTARLIFPHELGHILGAGHECERGRVARLGLFNESHCYSNGSFGTIMTVQFGLKKIEQWSNPSVSYPLSGGVPTGDLSADCPSNNAATIDSTLALVSKFRCRQSCSTNGSVRSLDGGTTNPVTTLTPARYTDSPSSSATSIASTSNSATRVGTSNVWLIALGAIALLVFIFLLIARRRKKNDIVT
jgi:LPXTG-motif cell wall-anchored protein